MVTPLSSCIDFISVSLSLITCLSIDCERQRRRLEWLSGIGHLLNQLLTVPTRPHVRCPINETGQRAVGETALALNCIVSPANDCLLLSAVTQDTEGMPTTSPFACSPGNAASACCLESRAPDQCRRGLVGSHVERMPSSAAGESWMLVSASVVNRTLLPTYMEIDAGSISPSKSGCGILITPETPCMSSQYESYS